MYVVVLEGYRSEPCLVVVRKAYPGSVHDGFDYILNSREKAEEHAKELQEMYPDCKYSVKRLSEQGQPVKYLEPVYTRKDVLSILASVGKVEDEILPVRDGFVVKGSKVWWHSESGPSEVVAGILDWENIRKYPDCYSLQKPSYEVVYKY